MPEQFDIHHHEVQEIMGRMPGWVTRWTSTGLLGGFLLLVFTADLVRFPDQVPAQVQIIRDATDPSEVRVQVPIESAAAVHPGQSMLIDLDAYPARQYGYLRATITEVLPFSATDFVQVRVALPAQWQTTTGYEVARQPLLRGQGAITVSETTLLRRICRY
ncbi:hypothetical protein [Hymenobacter persicinus]|uniref:HlyD family efflux transporter periplasmic adaptor subunit n=1 Tax=Hymenobacter persicinus TaxID=2025506 RepID=A0A4Q5L9Z3_9BACT|nr:hypothetical protein [Hymenobacter persicinus]RYU77668.1 hypothetical protein EWM57_17230 [Hymenobacter persicinus]